ncbi:hypothetical protein NGRA_2770 [Nosema granulosis]|uniref:Uncharacterized protein n=1 Tax=Nosema granulosis TaxID=83296 RepID=A0A9P6KY46_9MICR|nr:hypothetical protein NGRA_2770 [Nosema granulosis]
MVLKNLKFHGCYKLYKSSNDFRDLFKMLLSIPFLPLKRIITDYSLLKIIFKRKFSEDLDLHNFLMYFEKNFLYVNSKRGFHYDIWNVNNRIMMFTPITKKSAEAYNKSLGDEFANSHPSLVLFIQKLRCREFTYSD